MENGKFTGLITLGYEFESRSRYKIRRRLTRSPSLIITKTIHIMCSRLGAGFTPGKIIPFHTLKGRGSGSWGFDNGTRYNARIEGLASTWRSLNRNRGIITVPSFWERDKEFIRNDGSPLNLGIIYNGSGEFAVITAPANEIVKPFHHRMPLILTDEGAEEFLKGSMDIHQLGADKLSLHLQAA
jgi:putative SOS response-associated peptidase YedK